MTLEQQALVSRAMHWNNGKLYIVELQGKIHEKFAGSLGLAVINATGTDEQFLLPCRSSFVRSLEYIEPDSSVGSNRGIGAVLPASLGWRECHTLNVEVGVSRGWLVLDGNAREWATPPGVEYILRDSTFASTSCIRSLEAPSSCRSWMRQIS